MTWSWSRLGRLTAKEMRETLRDRRTMLTLVLMPLLVYPLLSMALNRFLLSSGSAGDDGYVVGVDSVAEATVLESILADDRSQPPDAIVQSSGGGIAKFRVQVTEPIPSVDALAANQLDVAVHIRLDREATRLVEVIAYSGDEASLSARRILIERLQWLRMNESTELLRSVMPDFPAIEVTAQLIGTPPKGSMLGSVIPLVLVLMTITGAVYPAIDLTAGERERGTMEALMASPVPRGWVLLAKYFAVVLVALLTALMNLLAMYVTLSMTGLLSLLASDGESVGMLALLKVLGLLVLFSGFFSAVLLSLTSFAKSFKEAQAYLIPVMLLSLGPAMLSLMPGMTLSGPLAVVPLLNIVLLAQEVLSGDGEASSIGGAMAIASTGLYAAAALGLAAKLFGNDAVTRTSEQSIGSIWRRPRDPVPTPSPAMGGLVVALLLPASFIVSNALTRWVSANDEVPNISLQLVANAIGLVLAFGLIPALATWLGRHSFADTYRLQSSRWIGFLGAALIACGAWAYAHELVVLADQFGLALLSDDQLERTRDVLEKWKQVPPWLLLATLAAAPALIEEWCFRGFLFSALRNSFSARQTIWITAFLFGMFHVFVGGTLLIERFAPTMMLGLILGWVASRTGSVWPGITLHFLHNALLELVGRYHERFEFLSQGYESTGHLPISWLLIAGAAVGLGACIIWWFCHADTKDGPRVSRSSA
ncbi:MAG: ABC transporter permease subunit/CPBP intramembrane protease [Planctomycetota bacterium]